MTSFLFAATRDKLLQMDWFRAAYDKIIEWRALAQQLIEKGIRVNAVAPGPVWTPLVQQSFDPEQVSRFGEDNPMERPAQPVEIAPAFVFLASDEGRFVNGEILGVTGGRLLG